MEEEGVPDLSVRGRVLLQDGLLLTTSPHLVPQVKNLVGAQRPLLSYHRISRRKELDKDRTPSRAWENPRWWR